MAYQSDLKLIIPFGNCMIKSRPVSYSARFVDFEDISFYFLEIQSLNLLGFLNHKEVPEISIDFLIKILKNQ